MLYNMNIVRRDGFNAVWIKVDSFSNICCDIEGNKIFFAQLPYGKNKIHKNVVLTGKR